MSLITRKTKVLEACEPDDIPWQSLMDSMEPVILKGLVKSWPLVQAGLESHEKAIDYLKSFYNDLTVGTFVGPPEIKGKFFYNDDLSGLNFEGRRAKMSEVLDDILAHHGQENSPTFYINSTTIDACLPKFREHNDLQFQHEMFTENKPLASIWIGTPTLASAHYDAPNNIACSVVGHRRFTLFPPDQIFNLYPGPLEPTPGGQVVSMVDFDNPDFEKFPNFREAISAGQVADLEPGDALFYPGLWWHQVEALSPFNTLINYWWNTSPKFMGSPMNVLKHAILSLRDRPEHEKQGWKNIFDYYVFGSPENTRKHLPESAWGQLGPVDDVTSRKLRAFVINALNR